MDTKLVFMDTELDTKKRIKMGMIDGALSAKNEKLKNLKPLLLLIIIKKIAK